MGFKGVELEVRTRAFFTTIAEESFLYEEVLTAERELHLNPLPRVFG
jgi:hypothetical protein